MPGGWHPAMPGGIFFHVVSLKSWLFRNLLAQSILESGQCIYNNQELINRWKQMTVLRQTHRNESSKQMLEPNYFMEISFLCAIHISQTAFQYRIQVFLLEVSYFLQIANDINVCLCLANRTIRDLITARVSFSMRAHVRAPPQT